MSKWRKNALEFLPELKVTIESSESPTMLWLDIFFEFETAVQNTNEDFIKRVIKYLVWCSNDNSEETQNAVFCGFLEDLATKKNYWQFFQQLVFKCTV